MVIIFDISEYLELFDFEAAEKILSAVKLLQIGYTAGGFFVRLLCLDYQDVSCHPLQCYMLTMNRNL